MHTLSADGRNLLELLEGFVAAEQHATQPLDGSIIDTLAISDVLYNKENGNMTLRQLVAIIDNIGQSSPPVADVLAAHFAVAACHRRTPVVGVSHTDVFSVNSSEPHATVQITIGYGDKQIHATRHDTTLTFTDANSFFVELRNLLWITHSAALCGVLSRIAEVLKNPLNSTDIAVQTASLRALVYAAAERYDHAHGHGPYVDGDGYGEQFDVTGIATLVRHAVFAHLNLLAEQCEPPLRDALGVVSGRAINQFGAPPPTEDQS